jgi:hypothetical protein
MEAAGQSAERERKAVVTRPKAPSRRRSWKPRRGWSRRATDAEAQVTLAEASRPRRSAGDGGDRHREAPMLFHARRKIHLQETLRGLLGGRK